MRSLFTLCLLAAPAAAAPLSPPALPQGGSAERVIIKADGAWVGPKIRLSPAFVLIEGDRVRSVSNRRPRSPGRVVEVQGTLAAGLVDAWSGLVPADLRDSRQATALGKVADSLPADLPGADPELAARVAAARRAGVAGGWLSVPAARLELGVGTSAAFSVNDLPVAAGEEALEFALGAPGSGAQGALLVETLADRFEAALARRAALEEFEEKLEKYEEDLKKYEEKLAEYLKENPPSKNGKKNGKKNGAAMARPQDGGQKPADEKKAEGADKAPKRPKRPQEPARNPGLELLLDAVEGRISVRVRAHSVRDIQRLLELQRLYDLELVILGADEADLLADELAAAEVPVVLGVEPAPHRHRGEPNRSLAARYLALRAAGVEVALGSGPVEGAAGLLLLRAGEIVAAGAEVEDVWAALTSVPAGLLGLEDMGELRSNKRAQLVLFEGASPFDASRPFRVYIPGRGFE